ncbi:hypothetical protein ACFWUU_04575 [Kribbella sp. NPDC058693]|uniref:hypothetical protein n=1 Tax=Kribbella sp. NPDC058693 TaxID=3346602 RepID=UPI0036556A0F
MSERRRGTASPRPHHDSRSTRSKPTENYRSSSWSRASNRYNSAGEPSYAGPCPPSGTHHYRFTVYALSKATGFANGTGLDEALKAIDASTIARGRLTAVYKRQ